MIFLLFLTPFVLSGCINGPAEDGADSLSNDSDSGAALDWERTFDNTTYLVRIHAEEEFTIIRYIPHRPADIYASTYIIIDHLYSINAGFGQSPFVVYGDLEVDDPRERNPQGPREVESTFPPGTYHVVFDSKDIPTTFTVTSENATLEILAEDPNMANFRWDEDEDWDYHQRIQTPRSKILHATTTIPLHHNTTFSFVISSGEPWDVEFDPGCAFHMPGTPLGFSSWWLVTNDRPMELTIQTQALFWGASLDIYTLDLPMEFTEPVCAEAPWWDED